MQINTTGKITEVGETMFLGKDGTFAKKLVVIEAAGNELLAGFLVKDDCGLVQKPSVGQIASLKGALRSRPWTKDGITKYFTEITWFAVEWQESAPKMPAREEDAEQADFDDMPF